MSVIGNVPGGIETANVTFVPKVWSQHIGAYFDRKLTVGQVALVDRTLESAPGTTVNFPYFGAIGDVETPAEDDVLTPDSLSDASFSVTVSEVGKAVAVTDAALRKSAAPHEIEAEVQRQMARKYAEKVDKDLMGIMDSSNVAGFVAADGTGTMSVQNLLRSKVQAFGDKADQSVAVFMHSLDYQSMLVSTQSGLLQANANSPYALINGYMGHILNMALIVVDTVPELTAGIGGKRAFAHYIVKENPFGLYMAQDLHPEKDRFPLGRKTVWSSTMWYGVLSLNQRVSALDKRVARGYCATELAHA